MDEAKKLLMVNVSGPDRPGITAIFTKVLVGLGIAYNAKKGLDQTANVSLGRSRLTNILHLLGITEEDITEALACKPS